MKRISLWKAESPKYNKGDITANIEVENSMYRASLELHQQMIDLMLAACGDDGICCISTPQIADRISRSQTWVMQAIKRVNTEDCCIEMIAPGRYVVHYQSLAEQGVFYQIDRIARAVLKDDRLLDKKEEELADLFGVKIRTVKMFKGYYRHG